VGAAVSAKRGGVMRGNREKPRSKVGSPRPEAREAAAQVERKRLKKETRGLFSERKKFERGLER